jgi:hypothetical protein
MRKIRILSLDLNQKLFQPDSQRLDLEFLNNQGHRAVILPPLEIKDTLSRWANGIDQDMGNWLQINLVARHNISE